VSFGHRLGGVFREHVVELAVFLILYVLGAGELERRDGK